MEIKEPLAKRIWRSKAFVVTFSVFALGGIIATISAFLGHYSLFRLVFELIVSIGLALIFGLILYGLESLASRTRWGKKQE